MVNKIDTIHLGQNNKKQTKKKPEGDREGKKEENKKQENKEERRILKYAVKFPKNNRILLTPDWTNLKSAADKKNMK